MPLLVLGMAAVGQTRKLCVIAIDGLRSDALEQASAPNLHALIAQGSYSSYAQCEDLTFSGPNWSSILHGVHRDKHGIDNNGYTGGNLGAWPDFLTYLEQHRPQWNTFRLMTWDAAEYGQPTGADVRIFRDYGANGDELMTQDAVKLVNRTHPSYPQDPDAMFMFYSDADVAGHGYGFHPSVPQYLAEIANIDSQIGRLMTAIRARATYANENWLFIVTTDHGGAIDGGHSGGTPEKRRIPFIVSGPSAVVGTPFPEAKNVDVAKTALAFMGVSINPQWNLDGHVVGLAPSGRPPADYGVNLIFNGGGEFDRGFADATPDQSISGWDDPGPNMMTVIRYGSSGYPSQGSPGPPARGVNMITGGLSGYSQMTQTIPIGNLAADIDTGTVRYRLSGYLGGYASQEDAAKLSAHFLAADGTELASLMVGPVTAADRANVTGLLYREATSLVPRGARSVKIKLTATRAAGSACDGYADNLEIVLTCKRLAADLNDDGVVDDADLTWLILHYGLTDDCPP